MTIIAWDGKTLAAGKASTNCGYRRTCTKIFRVPGGLVGFAGNGSRAMALLEWFRLIVTGKCSIRHYAKIS